MRLFFLSFVSLTVILYGLAAFESYREEVRAREEVAAGTMDGGEPSRHPEANLRRVRNAFASQEYTDDLKPYLERALSQVPTFYQPPFLLAAFYANRIERPDVIEDGFEAAIARFPSNGRLHLTYAQWLLTPRTTAPYRAYAGSGVDDRNPGERAMTHITRATTLEPDLVRHALELLLRFRIPVSTWLDVLPDEEPTHSLTLEAADRAEPEPEIRRELLATYLSRAETTRTLRSLAFFGRKWEQEDIALRASGRWHRIALARGTGSELTSATLVLVRDCLDMSQSDRAYTVLRTSLSALAERNLAEDHAALLVGAGNTYLARGRIAMAEGLFTEAVTLFPYHANAHLGLAHSYQRANDTENALHELRRALALDPENSQARALLDELTKRR